MSYLSSTIWDEFITLMGEHVLNHSVKELKSAKYFSVTVDSTPVISHVDQLTSVLRYILSRWTGGALRQFLNIRNHTGQELAKNMFDFLGEREGH